jgi:hypothetical protein
VAAEPCQCPQACDDPNNDTPSSAATLRRGGFDEGRSSASNTSGRANAAPPGVDVGAAPRTAQVDPGEVAERKTSMEAKTHCRELVRKSCASYDYHTPSGQTVAREQLLPGELWQPFPGQGGSVRTCKNQLFTKKYKSTDLKRPAIGSALGCPWTIGGGVVMKIRIATICVFGFVLGFTFITALMAAGF